MNNLKKECQDITSAMDQKTSTLNTCNLNLEKVNQVQQKKVLDQKNKVQVFNIINSKLEKTKMMESKLEREMVKAMGVLEI